MLVGLAAEENANSYPLPQEIGVSMENVTWVSPTMVPAWLRMGSFTYCLKPVFTSSSTPAIWSSTQP